MSESDELPVAATPGTVLDGKYRVEHVLGRGGMGVVLAATHIELSKRVAGQAARGAGTVGRR